MDKDQIKSQSVIYKLCFFVFLRVMRFQMNFRI